VSIRRASLLILLLAFSPLVPAPAAGVVVIGRETTANRLVVSFSNLGYFGNLLNPNVSYSSCEYPAGSGVEHWFVAGLWVGARKADDAVRVSVSADDTGSGTAHPPTEFGPRTQDVVVELSNDPDSPRFSPQALADQHFLMSFDDENGAHPIEHVPLGVRVHTEVLAYAPQHVDDFVLLSVTVENIGDETLRDVYLGWYADFTIGDASGSGGAWNFYDDVQGFYGPNDVPGHPDLWMMYGYDPDADDGAAPSWIGVRPVGSDSQSSLFTYRQWRFRGAAWPRDDQTKYAAMASGQVDVGAEFEVAGNWSSMIAVGPWSVMAPGETANITLAVVAGMDADELVEHSDAAQETYDRGFQPVPVRRSSLGGLKSTFRRQ
jgi:hypothetical protein